VWFLRAIEQEVDSADGVDRPGGPDSRATARQRRRPLARQPSDELATELRVLVIEMRLTGFVGDREDLLSTAAQRRWNS